MDAPSFAFEVVETPTIAGGRAPESNPFEPVAPAAINAQKDGKSIAFPLDVEGHKGKSKTVKGEEVALTAAEVAAEYTIRKIRELGEKYDRTFTVVVTDGLVTVTARERIKREKKAKTESAEK